MRPFSPNLQIVIESLPLSTNLLSLHTWNLVETWNINVFISLGTSTNWHRNGPTYPYSSNSPLNFNNFKNTCEISPPPFVGRGDWPWPLITNRYLQHIFYLFICTISSSPPVLSLFRTRNKSDFYLDPC